MSTTISLEAQARAGTGKGAARSLRREKKTPAVIYGNKQEPLHIQLPQRDIIVHLNAGHFFTSICKIDVDGTKEQVIARDIQVDPIRDTIIHVDFLRVTSKTVVTVSVPVVIDNEDQSPGIENGGVLNIVRHEVELNCRATDIPDSLHVDLSQYDVGDTVNISNIALPAGVEPTITDRDFTIATIAAPHEEEEEEELEETLEGEETEETSADEAAEETSEKEG